MASIQSVAKSNDEYTNRIRKNLRAFHENLDAGNFSTIESRLAQDYFWNYDSNIIITRKAGRMALESFVTSILSGLHAQDIYNIVDGNQGAVLFRISGRQSGPFIGLPLHQNGHYNVMSAEIFTFNDDAEARQVVTLTPIGIMKEQMRGAVKVSEVQIETMRTASGTDLAHKTLLKQKMASMHLNANIGDLDSIASLSAEDVEVNENGSISYGREAFVNLVTAQNAGQGAFPEKVFHDLDILVDGSFGAIHFIWQAQQASKYHDIEVGKASSSFVRLRSTLFLEFNRDGLIAKVTGVYDEHVVNATLTGTGGYLYP